MLVLDTYNALAQRNSPSLNALNEQCMKKLEKLSKQNQN